MVMIKHYITFVKTMSNNSIKQMLHWPHLRPQKDSHGDFRDYICSVDIIRGYDSLIIQSLPPRQ